MTATSSAQSPPQTFSADITNGTQVVTVDFQRHSVRSSNFSVAVQNSSGGLDPYTAPESRTYLGTVAGYPGAIAAGTLKPNGTLLASISFEDGVEWIKTATGISTRGNANWSPQWPTFTISSGGAKTNVYAAELGIDSSWNHFNRSGLNVDENLYTIEHSVVRANAMYLRDAGIFHRIGRIVIRGDQATDPYNGLTGGALLDQMRNQWNNVLPPSTHDVAAMISASSVGGGLAWVGVIGTASRYSVNDSEGSGDFTAVWRHEVGHNWGANHYEGGGKPEGPTIMSDNSLARISTPELSKIVGHRDTKLGILDNLGRYSFPLPPRASMDRVMVSLGNTVTIDALANDHDGNGDAISLDSFDSLSRWGGSVTRSLGTGPGGRDQLIFQPVGNAGLVDWIRYRIVDGTGRPAVGIIYSRLVEGTIIGSSGSWGNNAANTKEAALDGNLNSFYDAVNGSGDWVGLDYGQNATKQITQINYCPRSGNASRMVGGVFQGANDPSFSVPVTLFAITTAPAEGAFTQQPIADPGSYRYVRYLGPANGFCNVAEIEFIGNTTAPPPVPAGLTATPISGSQIDLSWMAGSGASSYNVKRGTSGGSYITIAAGVTTTNYSDSTVVNGTTYYYVVSAVNSLGESGNSGPVSATAVNIVKLPGTIIGTPGSWGNNPANTREAAMDANLTTFYDAVNGSGDWVGLDLGAGASNVVTKIKYAPRSGQEARMNGGMFQAANVADFSSGVVTLFTINGTPPAGVLTVQSVANNTAYRYLRYYGPANGFCNVAEIEFWGSDSAAPPPPAPTGLSATAGNAVVDLAWTQSTGAGITGNKVYRSTGGSGGPYNLLVSLPASTSYSDTAVVNGSSYFYTVTAANAAGESEPSAYKGATPFGSITVTLTSAAAHDGYLLESSETSDVGGSTSATASNSSALRAGDNNADRQYKSVLSFDTSSIPDGATILSVTLKLKRGTVSGTNPFTTHGSCFVDVKGGTGWGGSTTLANSDFEAAADATQVATLGNAANNGDWSTGSLNATGCSLLNKTGHTQFRVYFSADDNDDAGNDYIGWYSGDNGTVANRPVLEVTYQ